ncbi:MAG TPA: glycine-rich protein [Candidatus Tumulicola sp.]|jgi:hypothetical protein
MKNSICGVDALILCLAATALSSCSAYQPPTATPAARAQIAAQISSQTFKYTGAEQVFRVPRGVTEITVLARGGGTPSGDYGSSGPYFTGSNGGLVQATIPVKPGERLAIFVGGKGQLGLSGAGGLGGFNGGGIGGVGIDYSAFFTDGGCGGAGASDVRVGGDRLKDRVIVAGGGGGPGIGGGFYGGGAGGLGGGNIGGPGGSGFPGNPSGFGGLGGTQSAGGAGGPGGQRSGFPQGIPGDPGKLGRGGLGGGRKQLHAGGGGGGGGGYYGGGGGGSGTPSTSGVGGGGGGGGGSSYVEPGATHVKNIQAGASSGNGKVVLSW